MQRTFCLFLLCLLPVFAERYPVTLRDPSRPALIKINTINGSVQVKTHAGKDVVLEMDDPKASSRPAPNGMKRIDLGGDFRIEEENNVVTVHTSPNSSPMLLLVPEKTSLNLKSVNAKEIRVEGVDGEINVETVNGSIRLVDVAGVVVAHSVNGKLTATIRRIAADKPMSFSTLNGTVDVTMPTSTKADLKLSTHHGSIYTDFDMPLTTSSSTAESNRDNGPKYKLKVERTVVGKLNGGGPEFTFRSLNGTIYIRKGN